MKIEKRLSKIGITDIEEIDLKQVRIIANNITEILTKTFPVLENEYNNILIQLLNCKMYIAKIDKKLSKVNYIYENNSIYFSKELDLNKVNEQMIHECIHYIQDIRNKKGNLEKIGFCKFADFSFNGLGLNEAAVQYIAAKTVKNEKQDIDIYGISLKTISPNYYPILTNIIEQIIYLIGEDEIVKGTIINDEKTEDYILNIFEEKTKKIINLFDRILELKNKEITQKSEKKKKEIQEKTINTYMEVQELIFSTYFEKICTRLESIQEIDKYLEKAKGYKKYIGIKTEDIYNSEGFYEIELNKIINMYDNRLYQINKEKTKNMLAIIKGSKLMNIVKNVLAYFQE